VYFVIYLLIRSSEIAESSASTSTSVVVTTKTTAKSSSVVATTTTTTTTTTAAVTSSPLDSPYSSSVSPDSVFSKKSVSFPRFRPPERIQLVVQNFVPHRPIQFPPVPLSSVTYFSNSGEIGTNSTQKDSVTESLLPFVKLLNDGSNPISVLITLETIGSKGNGFSVGNIEDSSTNNFSFSSELPQLIIPSEITLTIVHMFK
jgi:hypothetical protein